MYTNYPEFLKESKRLDSYLILYCPREPKYLWMPSPFTWTLDSGSLYWTDYPLREDEFWHVYKVIVNGVEATPRMTKILAGSNAGSFFYDINAERKIYLRTLDDSDPTDSSIQILPIVPIYSDISKKQKFVEFDLSSFVGTPATKAQFKKIILENGLDNIKYSLESAYVGVTLPETSGIGMANVKGRVININGFSDRWLDDKQVRDSEIIYYGHGDAGDILTFDEHRSFGSFRVINGRISSNSLKLEVKNELSFLNKMFPTTLFHTDEENFEADVKGKWIPEYWGSAIRVKTYKISEHRVIPAKTFDSVQEVWKITPDPFSATLLTLTTHYTIEDNSIVLVDALAEAQYIEARITRCVDLNGDPTALQLAGAWLRRFLIDYLGIHPSKVPIGPYQDLDDDYPTEVIVEISGEEQQSGKEILTKWCQSMFGTVIDANGTYIPSVFDPDNISSSVATIYESQMLSEPEKYSDPAELHASVIMTYGHRPNDNFWNQTTKTLTTAPWQYKLSDQPFVIEKSYLKNKADADKKAILYLCLVGREKSLMDVHATGEIVNAYSGQNVDVVKNRGFSINGTWQHEQFKLRSSDLFITNRPEGSAKVTLEEIITPEIRDAILAYVDNPPVSGTTDIEPIGEESHDSVLDDDALTVSHDNPVGGTVIARVYYTMTDANPDIAPTSVEYNGEALTLLEITDTSTNIRVAMYGILEATADTGVNDLDVVMPNVVASLGVSVRSYSNVASFGDVDKVYQASGKVTQGSVTTAVGDLVIDAYIAQRAVVDGQQSLGPKQELDTSFRVIYSGVPDNNDSLKARGSRRIAEELSVTMKHTEDYNNVRKGLVIAVLEP